MENKMRGCVEMNVKRATVVLLLTALGVFSGARLSLAGQTGEAQSYRIAVDVGLVVLHAVARDRKGRFVLDLQERDFEVYEDGVRQSIRLFEYEDAPVTAGVVVDHSGSMRIKLIEVIAGARAFIQSGNPEDEMFVVNFNENTSLGLPESLPFTNRPSDLELAISNSSAMGMTALYDAIAKAIGHLKLGSHDKKVILVISDGGNNAGTLGLDDILKMAERSNVIIYTIGLADIHDPDRNPAALKRLTKATGGESFFPRRLGDVVEVCKTIAHDIRNQYTIGYVSTNASLNGAYRSVKVVARTKKGGKLDVRTRTGYVAVDPSKSGKDEEDAQ